MSIARSCSMAIVAASVGTLAGLLPSPARAQAPGLQVYGPGNVSCATYLADRSLRINADGWILGFWTGMNFLNEANHTVGKSTEPRGIVAEVTNVCRAQPTIPLYKTEKQVYDQWKSDGVSTAKTARSQ